MKGSIDESADGTNTELVAPVDVARVTVLKIDGPGVVFRARCAGPVPAIAAKKVRHGGAGQLQFSACRQIKVVVLVGAMRCCLLGCVAAAETSARPMVCIKRSMLLSASDDALGGMMLMF